MVAAGGGAVVEAGAHPEAALPAAAAAVSHSVALEHPTLLIVDDNVRLARTVAAYMQMEGFDAQAAHSAEEALYAVRLGTFDAALVDINMPGMDGIEVCRRIREMAPSMRVVILTGRDAEEDPHRAAQVGAKRLLIKPISLSALRDAILEVLAG